jgi:hypothetical protein
MTRAAALLILSAAAAALIAGCGATVIPPRDPPEPVRAYLADYGRHSSILLPTNDGRALHEYAFGDWDWFAAGRTSLLNGLDAMFASDGSALGRRSVAVGPDPSRLADRVGADRLLAFEAPRAKVVALETELDARYRRNFDSHVYNPDANLAFVHDDERYSFWHNCNHVTAEWLEALGCEVRGSRITSRFKFAKSKG